MSLYDKIVAREERIAIIGLGYVGLPVAVAFSKKAEVIGFDNDAQRINQYKNGTDPTKEVGDAALQNTSIRFTSDEAALQDARVYIIAVPTPINSDKTPDLSAVIDAARAVGRNLKPGAVVVLESTVYPGVTEEVCIPLLENESGLRCPKDFKVGYSPERINPGDTVHRLDSIVKIVSGIDDETLEVVAQIYGLVVGAKVYKAQSIKVAEAAKVIENSQRDINIAFMNELSIIFNKIGIDTNQVLKAAGTKWNFLDFRPGLVGGHCIGVDPYYLTYIAEQSGYHAQVILSGRRINDDMGKYVAHNTVKTLVKAGVPIKNAVVAILGLTFKENIPDTRNSQIIELIHELSDYGITPVVSDPAADADEVYRLYGITLTRLPDIRDVNAAILAVAHDTYTSLTMTDYDKLYTSVPENQKVMIDIKGLLDKSVFEAADYRYWRL